MNGRMAALAVGLLVLIGASFASAEPATRTGSRIAASTPEAQFSKGAVANFSPESLAAGLKAAPRLIKTTGIACDVVQGLDFGSSRVTMPDKSEAKAEIYEVACKDGLGYVLVDIAKSTPQAVDCIMAAQSGKYGCVLPLNSHPATGLAPLMERAGSKCDPIRARFILTDLAQMTRSYEVACAFGGGRILFAPLADGSGPKPVAVDCLQIPAKCTMTPHNESVAMLANKLGSALGDACKVSDARYVGYVQKSDVDLYEIACQTGHAGVLLGLDPDEQVKVHWDCGAVKGVTCDLHPADKMDPLIVHAERTGANPPMMITDPDWRRRPGRDEFSKYYPPKGSMIAGQTLIDCKVAVTGSLYDCQVIDESPLGFDFGAASLKLAGHFNMVPALEDGVPIEGEHIQIPINFSPF